jgi:CubicO group peptidase (beta-lactamase class C family)
MFRVGFAAIVVGLLLGSAGVRAVFPGTSEQAVRAVVDGVVLPIMQRRSTPGLAVGLSWHGRTYFFPYGRVNSRGDLFRPDTLVEIGSCTKVFTTTLLALAVAQGQMSLSDSIQNYMPGGVPLRPTAQQVTPLELADFTSGMPNDPPDLPRSLEKRNIDHYTTRDFINFVRNWEPPIPLPAPYQYSNAGIGLLGYLVADATGKSWEDLLNAEITGPLQMPDTVLRPSMQQRRRLAQGHRPGGAVAPEWPVFAWYAAGGLRSTVRDMTKFGQANLGDRSVAGIPVPAVLTAAMLTAQQSQYQPAGRRFNQAMAWTGHLVDASGGHNVLVLKDGATAGFSSVIVLNHAQDLAVFAVANQAKSDIVGIGVEIARRMH